MNILVIGDIMLDINYESNINRTAPEADIPIHNINNTNYILGGASNVAQNLKYLGANIELISVIGTDYYGGILKQLLNDKQIQNNIFEDLRKTTQKHRIFNNNNTISVRYDIEDTHDISNELSDKIIDYVKNKKNIDAIIISDYNKGLLTSQLCKELISYANDNNIYTFIDPKIKNVEKYQNCFCFKPNLVECKIITKANEIDANEIENMFKIIKQKIKCENIVITCGKNGIYINDISNHFIHKNKIDVVDVTGAGDIVLTVLTYIFLKTKDLVLACNIANCIAGKSVQTIGNYNINISDIDKCLNICYKNIINKINSNNITNITNISNTNKILYDYEVDKIQNIKCINPNKKIVFTNGCFDILHSAHIKILQFSKNQGDILVVGINSNESIKRLKGEFRPINDINERACILSLFDFIDYLIIFDDNTPYKIIDFLKPNILVKGSEYKKEDVVGANLVNDVILFDYIQNKSTTLIVNKIKGK
jgi:D-beta-D-heptose 7-phosphate kinase/D-beta-D-heptose 1-phosphate adenosyltransferase